MEHDDALSSSRGQRTRPNGPRIALPIATHRASFNASYIVWCRLQDNLRHLQRASGDFESDWNEQDE